MNIYESTKNRYIRTKKFISEQISRAKLYWHVIETEASTWETAVSMPLSTRVWLWKHGFHSTDWLLYDFDDYGPDEYISGVQRRMASQINDPWNVLAGNKLAFYWMLSEFPDYQMKVYGIVNGTEFHPIDDCLEDFCSEHTATSHKKTSPQWVLEKLKEDEKLVFKPVAASGGKSVFTCEYDGETYICDGGVVDEATLRETINDLANFLVCEHINQTEFANELYPDAVSTLRILTCWDSTSERAFIPIAVYRVATDMSAPIDNWSAGGLSTEVDLTDGTLGKGARYPFSGTVQWYSSHPDTGAQIEGQSIPHWEAIQDGVLKLAEQYSHLPYLGWDVVPTENGFKIIEANDCTDVDLLQVHRPLLAEKQTREFLAQHNLV